VLLAKTIADVEQTIKTDIPPEMRSEGKKIIRDLITLKEDMEQDRQLRLDAILTELTTRSIIDDKQPNLTVYNDELRRMNRPTWLNVSWLYSECYLYRYFLLTPATNF
jgi:damage-control phosphatase, subfamily III